MIVDIHGHYTTAPQALWDWRKKQVSQKNISSEELRISDDEIRDSLEKAQLKLQRERGSDVIDLQDFAGHADPRTTLTYIRSRDRLSKSPAYVLRY